MPKSTPSNALLPWKIIFLLPLRAIFKNSSKFKDLEIL
jgi:hypothetical protein